MLQLAGKGCSVMCCLGLLDQLDSLRTVSGLSCQLNWCLALLPRLMLGARLA